jgi:hypothetical protein
MKFASQRTKRIVPVSRDNSDGTATGYALNFQGSVPGKGNKYSLLHSVNNGYEAQSASYK